MSTSDRYPVTRNPDGWYTVALADDLAPGQVLPLSCLGEELVLFRTASGEARVFDAYCPHLGAHLGHGGRVEGERLVCPFHGWCYDRGGRCVEIPYARRIPPRAAVRTWPVIERNGAILVWKHHLGKEPTFEVPELPGESWTETHWEHLIVEMHILDVTENGVDVAHFPKIHGCRRGAARVRNAHGIPFRFDLETSYPGDGIGMPGEHVDVTTEWAFYGPGVAEGVSTADAFGMRVRQLFHFTPIPQDRVHFRIGISLDRETIPEELRPLVLEQNCKMSIANLLEDAPIWKHKRFMGRPTLCDGDGPLGELRVWLREFFPDLAAHSSLAAGG